MFPLPTTHIGTLVLSEVEGSAPSAYRHIGTLVLSEVEGSAPSAYGHTGTLVLSEVEGSAHLHRHTGISAHLYSGTPAHLS